MLNWLKKLFRREDEHLHIITPPTVALKEVIGSLTEYDLSAPAIVPLLQNCSEDPEITVWRERNRDAQYAVRRASKIFARVVLEALENGAAPLSDQLQREVEYMTWPRQRPRYCVISMSSTLDSLQRVPRGGE